jgi:hypothetical protein
MAFSPWAARCVARRRLRLRVPTRAARCTKLTRAARRGAAQQVQQIAMLKQDLVVEQKWVSPAEFNKARREPGEAYLPVRAP